MGWEDRLVLLSFSLNNGAASSDEKAGDAGGETAFNQTRNLEGGNENGKKKVAR